MGKASCISHQPGSRFLKIQEDYIAVCDNDHCAAAILAVFESWTNTKLHNAVQAEIDNDIAVKDGKEPTQVTDCWVYMSQEDLVTEVLALFGERRLRDSLKYLVDEKQFLLRRVNPRYQWDKTFQYLLNVSAVQEAVSSISISGKNAVSKRQNLPSRNGKKAAAIPKNQSKNLPKDSLAPKNGARKTSEPKPRNLLFDSVAKHVFEIESDDELKAMNEAQGVGSRIMNIVQWLKGEKDTFKINGSGKAKSLGFISRAAEPEHVHMFVIAYKRKYNAAPPRDIEKFIEHWRAWASTLMKSPQPAAQNYHVARRGAGRAAATGAERDALLKELKGAK